MLHTPRSLLPTPREAHLSRQVLPAYHAYETHDAALLDRVSESSFANKQRVILLYGRAIYRSAALAQRRSDSGCYPKGRHNSHSTPSHHLSSASTRATHQTASSVPPAPERSAKPIPQHTTSHHHTHPDPPTPSLPKPANQAQQPRI